MQDRHSVEIIELGEDKGSLSIKEDRFLILIVSLTEGCLFLSIILAAFVIERMALIDHSLSGIRDLCGFAGKKSVKGST